jgi:hypothetical protein
MGKDLLEGKGGNGGRVVFEIAKEGALDWVWR